MMNQYQQKGILILVGILTLVTSFILKGEVEKTIFSSFAIISFILSAIIFAFEYKLWEIKYLYDWFVPAPNLNGEWIGNGKETLIEEMQRNGSANVNTKDFTDASITIEQNFSDIHLVINWSDNGSTEFDEAASFSVSGKKTKRLSFSAIYSYKPEVGSSPQIRGVFATISMASKIFENKPSKCTLTYATTDGMRQGIIELERKEAPNN